MPNFKYKAKKANAETVLGQVMAETREDAIEKVSQLGLIPVTMEQVTHAEPAAAGGPVRRGRVRGKEVYVFSRQLVSLIKAGIPLLRALEIISGQTRNAYFRDVIESIQSGVRGGRSFSQCLGDYPRIFSSLYVNLTRAGEESGRLRESLQSIAEYQRQQEELAAKVRSAIAYPILMVVFGVGTIIFVLTFVMPKISAMYVSLNQALPTATVIVMNISQFLIQQGLWLLLGLFVMIFGLKQWAKTAAGQVALNQMKIALPFLGPFWTRVEVARFTRAMRLLLQSGISIVRAIQLSIPVVNNELIRRQFRTCQDELIAGRSFGETLKRCPLVPELVGHLIAVGEESGSLIETLGDITESLEQETAEKIRVMTALLEPVMIIVVGAIVGFIVIAMLLPIFQLDVFAR